MTTTIPVSSEPLLINPSNPSSNSSMSEIETTMTKNMEQTQQNETKEMPQNFSDPVLLSRLRAQIEFYFSPKNLSRDMYLRSFLDFSQYPNGAAPLMMIASFPKVRSLCAGAATGNTPAADAALIANALEESKLIVVSPDRMWITCLFPLPPPLVNHPMQQLMPTVNDQMIPPSNAKTPSEESAVDNLAEQTAQLKIFSPKERTTVIVRDIREDCDVAKVLAAFTTEKVQPKSARPDIGKTWYILFNTEADAIAAVFASKGREIDGQPIRARVKSEATRSTEPSRSSSPVSSVSAPLPASDGVVANVASLATKHLPSPPPHVGVPANIPTQAAPPNYPHFPYFVEGQPYMAQQQHMYSHHYGGPVNVFPNGMPAGPPSNYPFPHHMQPYMSHGIPMPYPMHQHGPYYMNNANGLPPPNRHRNTSQHNVSGGMHPINAGNGPGQANVNPNSQVTMNPSKDSRDEKLSVNTKLNPNDPLVITSNQGDGAKSANKDGSHTRRSKNAGHNRGGNKSNGHNNNATQENSAKINGKQKGKHRKNRKNNNINSNNNSNNTNGNTNKNNKNGKAQNKEVIVMNTLNFPELKSDKIPTNNQKSELMTVSDSLNGVESTAPASIKLTGYAAALRQKRNKVVEETHVVG